MFNKSMQNKLLKLVTTPINIIILLLIGRFIVGLYYSCFAVGAPDAWRQTDGLSVAYAYYLRWTFEPFTWHSLLPAVLNSGHNTGIVAMEFPILNVLLAPLFYFYASTKRNQ